ncbi:MAG: class I SAM-dependent methyltransferase [Candidatus Eisenbacteria bacterium]|nr:class I SAM-dependent methyltransferase [Candidatus Eisenbacteria bacterium]
MSKTNEVHDAFTGTAYYYAQYRPGVPEDVVNYLRDRFHLDGTGVLLDMGCGTGLSTIAVAPLFARCVAFDTSSEMLDQARAKAPTGAQIEWQQRSDKDVSPDEGPYRLAMACRSFNWMDQYPLLDKLHAIVSPGGGIALIGDGSFWTGEEPWQETVRSVIRKFLGQDRRAGKKKYDAPTEPYTSMLNNSGYHDVQYRDVPVSRAWTVDSIIGYLYSTSFSARHLYGDNVAEFEAMMRNRLLELSHGVDRFVENAQFVVQSGMQE